MSQINAQNRVKINTEIFDSTRKKAARNRFDNLFGYAINPAVLSLKMLCLLYRKEEYESQNANFVKMFSKKMKDKALILYSADRKMPFKCATQV